MDSNLIPKKLLPVEQTSPEEDAKLLAIEALEARSVDPNPEPLIPQPAAVVVTPTPLPVSTAGPKPVPVQVIEPTIPTPPLAPIIESTAPKPIIIEIPKAQATPAEEMAEALAHAPAPSRFQFFLHQKPPRKPFVILIAVVFVIGIAVTAYFAIR